MVGQQHQQPVPRNASSSTQQGPRSASSSLTSPLEHGNSHVPNSGSQRSRASAIAALNSLMDEARGSPRKSDTGSATVGSTTRSKYSARSRHSANSAQAQLEALGDDERTARGKMEARTEGNLFKLTGQLPPTPIASKSRRICQSDYAYAKNSRLSRKRRGDHHDTGLTRAVPCCQVGEEGRAPRASKEPKEEDIWYAPSNVWQIRYAYTAYAVKGCSGAGSRAS
jgi:hypothetical protein